jgi:hypothetical protein
MNEVGSVGSVGSWFSNWATRSWRNVWELSSWFKPLALDVVVVEPVPDVSETPGIMVMGSLPFS